MVPSCNLMALLLMQPTQFLSSQDALLWFDEVAEAWALLSVAPACPQVCFCVLQDGVTASHVASQNGHKGVVKLLLRHGAALNLVTHVSPSSHQ